MTSESPMNTPNMDSKSWFQRWNFRQENISQQNEQDKEKEFTFLINDRPLNSVKADLIHAFLSVSFYIFYKLKIFIFLKMKNFENFTIFL
jgi:hypothetical protein